MSGALSSAYPQTSNTASWAPALSDIVLDAFERIGMRGPQLTQIHYASARRSLNYIQSAWSNRGINLWKLDFFQMPMPPGQVEYPVPTCVIDIKIDGIFLRQFNLGQPQSMPVSVSTTAGSNVVTVNVPGTAPTAGYMVNFMVPISVGGIVLSGQYVVYSVPNANQFTIQVPLAPSQTVTQGGVVPVYSTQANSSTVTVFFPNHGMLPGQTWLIQTPLNIAGLVLQGPYTVTSVVDANTFTIAASTVAGSSDQLPQNNGQALIAYQIAISDYTQSSDPVDLILFPLSSDDYAAIPQKLNQGRPTSYWFDRKFPGVIRVWPVPDDNGPYMLCYYAMTQMQNANPVNGLGADVPFRWLEAYTAELAAHLAIKFAPERAEKLMAYAKMMYSEAQAEDREKVSTFVVPDLSGYYR